MNGKDHITEILNDYIDGSLSEIRQKEAEAHLALCDACRNELLSLRSVVAAVGSLPKGVRPPADAKQIIEERIFESPTVRDRWQTISRKPAALWAARIAAALVLVIGAGVLFRVFVSRSPVPSESIAVQTPPSPSVIDTGGTGAALGNLALATRHSVKTGESARKGTDKSRGFTPFAAEVDTTNSAMPVLSRALAVAAIQTRPESARQANSVLATRTVIGIVRDSLTHEFLIGANVRIRGSSLGAATGADGRFIIAGAPVDTVVLVCSYVGYTKTSMVSAPAQSGPPVMASILLKPELYSAAEVRAVGTLPGLEKSKTPSAYITSGLSMNRAEQDNARVEPPRYQSTQESVHAAIRDFNTESYDRIVENEFLSPVSNPLSTFSIDVDVASYGNMRRFINSGQVPPRDAVRIEELVNYLSYNYPQPEGKDPVSVTTELASCPWEPNHQLLLVGMQGKTVATHDLPPSNLVFLLDVSGSMNEPNKLPLVKAAFTLLVKALRPQDRVAIVVYAGAAGLLLPSTPGEDKSAIFQTLDDLHAGGSTAGGEGILLAYKTAKENFIRGGNNRVILATDGDFNVGVSSDGDLVRLIEEKRKDGIFLSVLGFGMGNYKDSKMEKLADKGNGNYAYIDNLQEARRVLVGQMAGTLYTIAKDVKLQLEFNPAHVKAYRLLGYEDRMLAKEDFNDDTKDAGELGAGQSVTALYEIVPPEGEIALPGVDSLKYQPNVRADQAKDSHELMTLKLRYKLPDEDGSRLLQHVTDARETARTSENFRFAGSVAEFGLLIRDSRFKGGASYDHIIEAATAAKGTDRSGDRAEFIRLVETCRDLARSDHR